MSTDGSGRNWDRVVQVVLGLAAAGGLGGTGYLSQQSCPDCARHVREAVEATAVRDHRECLDMMDRMSSPPSAVPVAASIESRDFGLGLPAVDDE